MRLKRLQVSGFKSFVDPTTVTVPGSIVGIVGPNGCGKSNVIDAVRWVMGESSPRNLRGDSMADVIFNGSTARNPVGKAAVELVFDNSEGKAPGPYGQYAEISVKRSLSRDGQSDYFINRAKCRRRDITDIFLGTGLGPKSYSIIEQGMVSRIIEAKPEDLRTFVEEAAGISKYKDRRRETENRIRHTRENLSRIDDIRSELDALLRRLQRQSQAARRYKTLKQEERLLHAQLGALRWRHLDENINQYDRELAKIENQRQIQISNQREVENSIESSRGRHAELQDSVNQVQGTLYSVGAEIASIEQGIAHAADSRRQREQERQRLVVAMDDLEQQLQHDQQCLSAAESEIRQIAPKRSECSNNLLQWTAAYERAESDYRNWQTHWELFGQRAATPVQESEVQKSRIVELERHVDRLVNRTDQITDELKALDNDLKAVDVRGLREQVQRHDRVCSNGERAIDELDERLRHLRELSVDREREVEAVRDRHQELSARLGSLNELQAAALGDKDERVTSWLRSRRLDTVPRLASRVRVTAGWERAVDRVTNGALAAVCVDRIGRFAAELDAVDFGMFFIEEGVGRADRTANGGMLLEYIEADGIDLAPLLGGVYAVMDLRQGLAMRPQLKAHECAVTRAGTMIGPNWISLAADANEAPGVLAREQQIEQLSEQLSIVDTQLRALRTQQSERQDSLAAVEEERATGRRTLTAELARQTELHSALGRAETRVAQIETRQQQIRTELGELETQLSQERSGLQAAQQRLHTATEESGSYADQRSTLLDDREQLRAVLESARQNAENARDAR
ncbi:MAG: chromosome segregation protein SMC, partial [Gammaproteobacteria bacterium]|nr:chromosome segregation protein SMC [Gammaproteobacteria bacterium]